MKSRTRLSVQRLESRDVPSGTRLFALGENSVAVYEAQGPITGPAGPLAGQPFQQSGRLLATFDPFAGDKGSVHIAIGDVTGDGFEDVVVGAGTGSTPLVRVYDGKSLLAGEVKLASEFYAYDPAFRGGVFVAVGDQDPARGAAEIITGAGASGGPHVRLFTQDTPGTFNPAGEFFAFQGDFRGGVRVATGDFNDDGRADIVCAAGPGGGPHVRVFDYFPADPLALRVTSHVILDEFFAYDAGFRSGVYVVAGEFDGNSAGPEIVTTPSAKGGPHVRLWGQQGGSKLGLQSELYFGGVGTDVGYHVGAGNLGNLNGQMSFYVADGPGLIYTAALTGADQRLHAFTFRNGKIAQDTLYLPTAQTGITDEGLFIGV
jgi:hypothetical protein